MKKQFVCLAMGLLILFAAGCATASRQPSSLGMTYGHEGEYRHARCQGTFSALGTHKDISPDKVSLVPSSTNEEGVVLSSIRAGSESVEIRVQQGVNQKKNVLRIIRVHYTHAGASRPGAPDKWALDSASASGDGEKVVSLSFFPSANDGTLLDCVFAE